MQAKILIVDDESSMREVLGILLEKEGYAVRVCASGVGALKALQEEVFDLVITDLKMPQVGGIEVLRSAKSTNPKTEVIVLTAFGAAETAVEAMKLGAFDYIGKPFKVEEFGALVRRALGGKAFGLNELEVVQGYYTKESYGIVWNGGNIYTDVIAHSQ